MIRNLVVIINGIIIDGAIILSLLSLLFLGAKEDHQKLIEEPIVSFLARFALFGIIGVLGIGGFAFINFLINKTVLQNDHKINLMELFVNGAIIELVACLIGTFIFMIK